MMIIGKTLWDDSENMKLYTIYCPQHHPTRTDVTKGAGHKLPYASIINSIVSAGVELIENTALIVI